MASFDDYGLTKSGYVVPTDTQIKELVLQTAQQLGIPTNQETNSIKEVYLTLLSDIIARNYIREAFKIKQFSLQSAVGDALDDVVLMLSMSRLQAQRSTAKIVLTGNNNTIIESNSRIMNPATNDIFVNETDYVITNSKCVGVVLSIEDDLKAGDYSITLDNEIITASITQEQIDEGIEKKQFLTTLAKTINENAELKDKIVALVDEEQLKINSISPITTFSCVIDDNFTYDEVSSLASFVSEEYGAIPVVANTITEISTVISGLNSVYNPIEGNIGRDLETDEELRARAYKQKDNLNNNFGTTAYIENALYDVNGVSDAHVAGVKIATIANNNETTTDIYGISSIVIGGEDNEIAQKIFDSKQPGDATTGSSFGTAYDVNNVAHTIYFTRPTQKYAWIKIKMYKTNDATIPEDYIDGAKNAIMTSDYVKKHAIGQELTPCYINAAVCSILTTAIGKIKTTIATTSNPSITPNAEDYTEEEIIIEDIENVVFDKSRIDVEIVNSNEI